MYSSQHADLPRDEATCQRIPVLRFTLLWMLVFAVGVWNGYCMSNTFDITLGLYYMVGVMGGLILSLLVGYMLNRAHTCIKNGGHP